jgi:hypothetical protein
MVIVALEVLRSVADNQDGMLDHVAIPAPTEPPSPPQSPDWSFRQKGTSEAPEYEPVSNGANCGLQSGRWDVVWSASRSKIIVII